MIRHEDPELFDAKERYYKARRDLERAIEEVGFTIRELSNRIVELTEAGIKVHKAEEDKP